MQKVYPKQIYELLRIKIASEIMQKELRKLLPSIPAEQWGKIDSDIEAWFDGEKSELAAVHDFWNGFEGISQGFKLKKILPYLTAENISWSKREIPLDRIIFTTNLTPELTDVAKAPFLSKLWIDFIEDKKNQAKVVEYEKISDKHAKSSLPRDNYPIIVIQEKEGSKLLDGHRRVIRKILHGNSTINAYVGNYLDDKQPRNYWVSTGFLRNLIKIKDLSGNKKIQDSVDQIITFLKQNHQNVDYILPLRVLKKENRLK